MLAWDTMQLAEARAGAEAAAANAADWEHKFLEERSLRRGVGALCMLGTPSGTTVPICYIRVWPQASSTGQAWPACWVSRRHTCHENGPCWEAVGMAYMFYDQNS